MSAATVDETPPAMALRPLLDVIGIRALTFTPEALEDDDADVVDTRMVLDALR